MKKVISRVLIAGSVAGLFVTSALLASSTESQTIDKKAKAIVKDAQVKADLLVQDAKSKAEAIIYKAKIDAKELKQKSIKSAEETTKETKNLANEALQKAKEKSDTLVEKTKSQTQLVKQGIDDKYIYTKEATNKFYNKSKGKINDTLILGAINYAFLMSSNIHSMKIDVSVKNGAVELFGKVKSNYEAQEAMQIAISTKGVYAVRSFFVIEN
ncbi:MAG: BON domain-containing protein [Sulfurimonas sp.]|nr:BON domain-containing protein [Sulfurimonas sp.]